jgi:uncharacterized membrane protein
MPQMPPPISESISEQPEQPITEGEPQGQQDKDARQDSLVIEGVASSINTIEPEEAKQQPSAPPPFSPKPSRWDRWLQNNPDLEKFIGENLINKIGIAVLVLGIAFFVKYAIDQNWINETGRVSIGMACGALLIGLAHYLRKGYKAFSSVLAGGGIAVFYFTISFAFHQFSLLSQSASFATMVVITAFAIALSLLYDKMELAVIALVGGFLTPFLVSSGSGDYVVLFTYLTILNAGLLALGFFKRWAVINALAFGFTAIIYGGWLANSLGQTPGTFSYATAFLFATLLYLLFVGMNVVNQLRYKMPFRAFDFSILLSINAAYFAAGMLLLHYANAGMYQGLFTISMGAINLFLAYLFFRREQTDQRLLFLLIGLTLTFVSLAVPVQLHGHSITIFWSAEAVLLLWLYQRARIRLMRTTSLIVSALTLVSLFMDWSAAQESSKAHLDVLFNDVGGLVTNLVCVASFAIYAYLLRREPAGSAYFGTYPPRKEGQWFN